MAARAIPVPQRKLRAHLESLVVAEGLMSEVLTLEIAGGTAAVFSTRSPLKSTANEDVAAVLPCSPHHGVLAVADGLGGHAGGERASKLSIETIDEAIQDRQDERGGLPAPGHRACEDVSAGERGWDRVGLNGGRAREAELFEPAQKVAVELEAREGHAGPMVAGKSTHISARVNPGWLVSSR